MARRTTTSEDFALRFPKRAFALVIAFALTPLGSIGGSADQAGSLVAQREALQQQVGDLGPQRAAALTALLEAENQLNNERALLDHNSQVLADLDREQNNLQQKIRVTQGEIVTQRKVLATLTRERYKSMAGDNGVAVLFGASSFGQMINRAENANRVARRIDEASQRLRRAEQDLHTASTGLADKQKAAAGVQANLEQENAKLLAMVAAHDAAVAGLDATQRSLLSRIAGVSRAIAASQAPRTVSNHPASSGHPSGGFSSGSGNGGGGGGTCGNHFDYGYCTWYVATRRCIPWFGNADEWWANARGYGYPEGSQARVGAVVVWNAGPGYSSVGHVAYVESVQPDGFTVSEYNYSGGWNHYDTRFVSYSKPGPLLGFIYGK